MASRPASTTNRIYWICQQSLSNMSTIIHSPLVFTSSANVRIKRTCVNFNYKGLYHSTVGPSQLMVQKYRKRLFNKKTGRYANVEHNCSSSSSTIRSSSPMEYWVPSLGPNWDQASDNRGMIHWYWIKLNIHIFGPGFAIRSHSLLVNFELFIQVLPATSDRDTAGSCCFQFQKLFKESFRCHFILGIHHCLLMIPYWGYDLLGFWLFWMIFLSMQSGSLVLVVSQ